MTMMSSKTSETKLGTMKRIKGKKICLTVIILATSKRFLYLVLMFCRVLTMCAIKFTLVAECVTMGMR